MPLQPMEFLMISRIYVLIVDILEIAYTKTV